MATLTPSATAVMPTITPTPDLLATNQASFLILNATPVFTSSANVQFSMSSTDDLRDKNLSFERFGGSIQTLSVAAILFDDPQNHEAISSVTLVAFQDLDLDSEIEIAIEANTYGLGCCTLTFIVYYDVVSELYRVSNVVVRDSPLVMIDIDGGGRPEFVTRNILFNNMISSGGTDPLSPIQILRYTKGHLADVTAEYPLLIEADANFWLAAITGQDLPIAPEYLELMTADVNEWREQSLCGVESAVFSAYMYDMVLLDRAAEACGEIEAYYEQTEEPVCSNVVTRYTEGGDFCAQFTSAVEEWAQLSRADP